MRCHVVQRVRATSRRAEGPRDTTACRGTAWRYVVQGDRATPRRAETARRHVVQRDRATLQRAEENRANCSRSATATSTDRPQGVLDRRLGEPDAPCPSRRTLDGGEPTPNTLSVNSIFSIGFRQLYTVRHRTNMTSHAVVITMSKNEEYRYFSLSLKRCPKLRT